MSQDHDEDGGSPLKADKTDYAVAKHLFMNVTKRIGDLHGMPVDCFYAEDAVNCLLDSPWASGSNVLFTDRESCVNFCHDLLCKEIFHRAKLAKRKPKPVKQSAGGNDSDNKRSKKKTNQSEGESTKEEKPKEEKPSETDKSKPEEQVKKVKKLKLEMSDEQYFEDGREVYVWIYEPVSWRNTIIGSLILVGLVAVCCYPLWPPELRNGVYYLSILAAGGLGVILFLAIFRYVVYYLIYGLTFGEHLFFLFPNLTEDCGFFESFVPLFSYSRASDKSKKKGSKDKSKEKPESTPNEKASSVTDDDVTEDSKGGDNKGDDEDIDVIEDDDSK